MGGLGLCIAAMLTATLRRGDFTGAGDERLQSGTLEPAVIFGLPSANKRQRHVSSVATTAIKYLRVGNFGWR